MKSTISQRKANGKVKWCLDIRSPGQKRQRRWFKTKTEAENAQKDIKIEVSHTGHAWGTMEAWKRHELIAIWGEVEAAGLTLRAVWDAFRANQAPIQSRTLKALIDELVTAKRSAQRSERYVKTLKSSLNQFARGREQVIITALTLGDVDDFIDSKNVASRSTWRSRISTMFKFAIRRDYISANPCARLETVTAPAKTPDFLSVSQVEACLQFLRKKHKHGKYSRWVSYRHALPWFVLTTFCGLRPEEAEKTRRSDINTKEGWVRVEAQTSKIRQRRVFYPMAPAMRLLASVLKRGRLPMNKYARRRVIRRLRERLGLKSWPKDVTRHTAATFWLAQVKSAGEVSEALGHSEKTLKKHYAGLATKEQAAAFWALCGPTSPASTRNGALGVQGTYQQPSKGASERSSGRSNRLGPRSIPGVAPSPESSPSARS